MRFALFFLGALAFGAVGVFAGLATIILSSVPLLGLASLGVCLSFFTLAIFCAMRAEVA